MLHPRDPMGKGDSTYRTIETYSVGCVSVDPSKVAKYLDTAISKEAENLHARIVQHEFDHLNGILYTRRLAYKDAFGFEDEIEKYWKQNEENKN